MDSLSLWPDRKQSADMRMSIEALSSKIEDFHMYT